MATVAAINELGSYAHNPRGNLWINDDSSYGQKMLMKMGWSKGKGLGKNEDGIKENLKVKFKNTNAGLGYKDQSYTNVMKAEYESILKSLSTEYSQPKAVNNSNEKVYDENESCKKKSRVVKRRIRYPKLFYGKDVSKYSEKDMKSIFICSVPSNNSETEKTKLEDSGSCYMEESKKELPKLLNIYNSQLDTYNSQLSISDYFNKKMKEKKDIEQKKNPSNEIEEEKIDFQCSETESAVSVPNEKKSRKRKKKFVHVNGDNEDLLNFDGKEMGVIAPNKKRKKLYQNPVIEEFSVGKMCEKQNLTENSQSSAHSKKKKKSHKKENCYADADVLSSCLSDINSNTLTTPNKKRKKSHKTKVGASENSVELLSATSLEHRMSEIGEKSIISNLNSNAAMNENLPDNHKKSTKLKNKHQSLKLLKSCLKSKKNKYDVKNVSFNEKISYKIIGSDHESIDFISDCDEDVHNDLTKVETSSNYELGKDSYEKTPTVQDSSISIQNGNKYLYSETKETSSMNEMNDSVTDLPSSKSTYYNSWVESQKQALKMKMYKSMLRNIKKHKILKTTNLSSIKGYGNWGFK